MCRGAGGREWPGPGWWAASARSGPVRLRAGLPASRGPRTPALQPAGSREGDEIADLLYQFEVRRDLEGVLAPRLEPEGPPDLPHRRVANAVLGGQTPTRPVRGIRRRGLQRVDDHRLDDVIADAARRPGRWRPTARRVDQRAETGAVTCPPSPGCCRQLVGDLGVGSDPPAQASTIRQRNASACDTEQQPSGTLGGRRRRLSGRIRCCAMPDRATALYLDLMEQVLTRSPCPTTT